MYFDRFDIIEAHYCYYALHHGGQGSREYERLCRIGRYARIRDEVTTNPKALTENGQEIYRQLVRRNRGR